MHPPLSHPKTSTGGGSGSWLGRICVYRQEVPPLLLPVRPWGWSPACPILPCRRGFRDGDMWWPVPGRRVNGERPPPGPQHKLVHSRSSDGHPGEKRRGESWQLSLGEHREKQGIRNVAGEVWLWSKDSDGVGEAGAAPSLLPVGPRQVLQTPALSPLTGGGQTGGCPRTPPALKDTVWECAHLASP